MDVRKEKEPKGGWCVKVLYTYSRTSSRQEDDSSVLDLLNLGLQWDKWDCGVGGGFMGLELERVVWAGDIDGN